MTGLMNPDTYTCESWSIAKLVKSMRLTDKRNPLLHLHVCWEQFGQQAAEPLFAALRRNDTITMLDISGNEAGDVSMATLAGALGTNYTLRSIDLSMSNIGHVGVRALAKGLKSNATLTHLDLGMNKLGDRGVMELSSALMDSQSMLTSLDLRCNRISPTGGETLSNILKQNVSLTSIDLQGNKLKTRGAIKFSECLSCNDTLAIVKLQLNCISSEGITALTRGLRRNPLGVVRMDLEGNGIRSSELQGAQSAMQCTESRMAIYRERFTHMTRSTKLKRSCSSAHWYVPPHRHTVHTEKQLEFEEEVQKWRKLGEARTWLYQGKITLVFKNWVQKRVKKEWDRMWRSNTKARLETEEFVLPEGVVWPPPPEPSPAPAPAPAPVVAVVEEEVGGVELVVQAEADAEPADAADAVKPKDAPAVPAKAKNTISQPLKIERKKVEPKKKEVAVKKKVPEKKEEKKPKKKKADSDESDDSDDDFNMFAVGGGNMAKEQQKAMGGHL
jgi:hypothetical protein